jgi:hypothetical protein
MTTSFAVPGIGSITDASGNVYAVTVGKAATENGKAMSGGGGTDMLLYWGSQVYGRDASTGVWYAWNSPYWTKVAASPPAPVITAVTVATVGSQKIGRSFHVSGTFSFASTRSLTLSDDASTTSAALTTKPETCAYGFTHPGYKKAGAYTVTVDVLGVSATSNKFTVS